ncbi:MAG: hypothetical protein KJ070_08555 [Verrucomicrobia bacterium]|nr:hypothetical protein [Verrucomicrobiota bacterium]
MKPRAQIILLVAVLLGLAAWSSMQRGVRSAATGGNGGACCPLLATLDTKLFAVGTNQILTNAATQQVIAYYFHGTVRCETCLLIEKLAKSVVEQEFAAELAADRLVFTSVNYELPEHAHFLTDYKLPCPSLVLVKQRDGKEEDWKLLADTWQLVHEPITLKAYLESEVRHFLTGKGQPATTNKATSPSAMRRETPSVAQVSNLLCRRLPVGRAGENVARSELCGSRGLEIRDTADWKSALRL